MEVIGFLLMFVFAAALYFLPMFVAVKRDHRNTAAIAILNLFLGWTLLGWVVSLVWAVADDTRRD